MIYCFEYLFWAIAFALIFLNLFEEPFVDNCWFMIILLLVLYNCVALLKERVVNCIL